MGLVKHTSGCVCQDVSRDDGPMEEKLKGKVSHEAECPEEKGEGDTSTQAQVPFFLTSVYHCCGALRTAEFSCFCLSLQTHTTAPQGVDLQVQTTLQSPLFSSFVDGAAAGFSESRVHRWPLVDHPIDLRNFVTLKR